MDGYELSAEPFFFNASTQTKLFHGMRRDNNQRIVAKCHEVVFVEKTQFTKEFERVVSAGMAQARVAHSGSCKILDLCLDVDFDRRIFYVYHILETMEKSLREDIKERQKTHLLPGEVEIKAFLAQTAEALAYAHEKGIAHRGIKPDNIFIDREGKYKIGDFGSCVGRMTDLQATTETLSYMSPQQRKIISGKGTKYNAFKSDVFSLGMTTLALAGTTKLERPWALDTLSQHVKSTMQRLTFSKELKDLLQDMLQRKEKKRLTMKAVLEATKRHSLQREGLSAAIKAAVQEATWCLDRGTEPESQLGRTLWNLPVEELQVLSSVTASDLQTLCETWASYQPTLHRLCGRALSEEDTALANLFVAVSGNTVELYDLQSQQSIKHTLSVNFLGGGSYIQVDTHTLLCLGGWPPSEKVYRLDLPSLTLTSLPSFRTPRTATGVAKVAQTVYAFGGCNAGKSCEKYELQERQWLPLGDMLKKRCCFTPCIFRTLIYLPCPFSTLTMETFSPETETFTVLPVSLPPTMDGSHSVSFVANGELCVLSDNMQIGRWQIESKSWFRLFDTNRKFRLFDLDRPCSSNQPPLIVDSLVLIANNSECGRVEKFSLESYAFI